MGCLRHEYAIEHRIFVFHELIIKKTKHPREKWFTNFTHSQHGCMCHTIIPLYITVSIITAIKLLHKICEIIWLRHFQIWWDSTSIIIAQHSSVFIDEKLNQPIRNTPDLYQGVDIVIVKLCYTKHTSHIHGRTLCGLAVSTMRWWNTWHLHFTCEKNKRNKTFYVKGN